MTEKPQFNEITVSSDRSGKGSYLLKSIRHMRRTLCNDMQTEHYARQQGWLQKVSPSAKLISMLILILVINLSRHAAVLAGVFLLTLLFMYMSRLPVMVLQKRIWLSIPLITLVFTLPMTLNIFVDGIPWLMIYQTTEVSRWLGISWPRQLFVSEAGITAVSFLFLRVGMSLSLGVTLVMTTPVGELFKSLRVIRVPDLFIMIMEMTYRYLMVLLSISIEMFEARSLRTVGDMPSRMQREQVGSSIGALFEQSMLLADEVCQAMAARCYTGEYIRRQPDQKAEISDEELPKEALM